MLSLGKLAPGQQQYYLDSVARGAEEYYTGAKEAPGQWVGSASGRLGLAGEVQAEQLGRLLEHVDPKTGTYRLTGSRSVPVVAGFDATFCAPKSVSLLFALGDREVSNEVRNAHDAAQSAALSVLERAACRVRRGQGGHTVLDGDGFVAAAFRHRTSRAGDPHLHTHVVLANLAHAPSDDRWTALDARPVYTWSSPVGHLYEAQLRWELTRRVGVEWGPVRNGIADVAGIPRDVLREFSTRRREIEAHLDEHGQHGARAAQVATYATRTVKDSRLDAEGLLPGWRRRAAALGFDTAALAKVLEHAVLVEPPAPDSPQADHLYRWLASPDGLTAKLSTFGEREVIKAICNALPHGGRVEHIIDLADGFLRSKHVVALSVEADPATIRLGDGTLVGAGTGGQRWTTPEMLQTELDLIDMASARQSTGCCLASPDAIEAAVRARGSLSTEQERMVRALCSSGDGVDLVEGVAGSGKTFALAVARDAWEASGHRVIGCSLAARAAKQLSDDAGITASTIDRLLLDLNRCRFAPGTVVVVDEAAMVGTRKLVRLLDHAHAAGAKVVLVGDPCQLPEIDAGGAFRGLRSRLGASVLAENRRQSDEWERQTLGELRGGRSDQALDEYQVHGRIHQASSDARTREALISEWASAHRNGEDVLMVAARLSDVDDLNTRARQVLQAEGHLGPNQLQSGRRCFAEGDRVLALRNAYRLGLLNGTRGVIERVDHDQQNLTVVTDGGDRRQVPYEYLAAGHLTHGYATTIHKAQGATVDRCLLLADDTTIREHAYTALSRGRYSNDLYATTQDQSREERHADEQQPDRLDGIRGAMRRSGAKDLALDHLHQQAPSTLEHLHDQRRRLLDRVGPEPPDMTRGARRLIQEQRHAEVSLEDAQQRLQRAEEDLDRLGPIRRHTHRTQRHEIEQRITRFTAEIDQAKSRIAGVEDRFDDIAPEIRDRAAWQARNAVDLERIDQLDHQIDIVHRLDQVARRSLEPTLQHEHEHGLEREL